MKLLEVEPVAMATPLPRPIEHYGLILTVLISAERATKVVSTSRCGLVI